MPTLPVGEGWRAALVAELRGALVPAAGWTVRTALQGDLVVAEQHCAGNLAALVQVARDAGGTYRGQVWPPVERHPVALGDLDTAEEVVLKIIEILLAPR